MTGERGGKRRTGVWARYYLLLNNLLLEVNFR